MRSTPRWFPMLLAFCAPLAAAAPMAYVSNEGSGTVSVIDTATDRAVSTVKLGCKPR